MAHLPPALDLTAAPEPLRTATADDAAPGVTAGLRGSLAGVAARRVWAYVLGLDAPVTELAGAIATPMRALTGSDLPVPLVEM
ncbi:hypothetical protein ACIBCL_13270 [Micromonospora zamorensis]|uniref:hypothetical protein n=1 Tax=Micromonospora zamorensis TaxID=709883 RepID=UPI0037B7B3F1